MKTRKPEYRQVLSETVFLMVLLVFYMTGDSSQGSSPNVHSYTGVKAHMQEDILSIDSPGTFPNTTGKNLNGRVFHLPNDFEGEINLVIIAFQRWHQRLVDTWLPLADSLAKEVPELAVYELPTLRRMSGISRWFINRGMRSGIPDEKARHRTITLYIDKEPFRKALKIPDEATIYTILVDRKGRLYWRAQGDLKEELVLGLEKAVRNTRKTNR